MSGRLTRAVSTLSKIWLADSFLDIAAMPCVTSILLNSVTTPSSASFSSYSASIFFLSSALSFSTSTSLTLRSSLFPFYTLLPSSIADTSNIYKYYGSSSASIYTSNPNTSHLYL